MKKKGPQPLDQLIQVGRLLKCAVCNKKVAHNELYDCYYCKYCNLWLETKCTDSECTFCTRRPEKPLNKNPS